MANERIRQAARECGVKLWQIAECWGCNDGNFSRRLRRELNPSDAQRALRIIDELRKETLKNAENADDQADS